MARVAYAAIESVRYTWCAQLPRPPRSAPGIPGTELPTACAAVCYHGFGGIDAFPLTGYGADGAFLILDGTPPPKDFSEFGDMLRNKERTGSAEFRVASPACFKTMGIPLIRGRLFEDRDTIDAPHVAVIDETLAESRWPGRDPIGLQISQSVLGSGRVTYVLCRNHEDDVFGNIRGVIADALEMPGHEN